MVDEYKSLKDELSKNWLSIEESIRDIIAQKMEDKKQILNIS